MWYNNNNNNHTNENDTTRSINVVQTNCNVHCNHFNALWMIFETHFITLCVCVCVFLRSAHTYELLLMISSTKNFNWFGTFCVDISMDFTVELSNQEFWWWYLRTRDVRCTLTLNNWTDGQSKQSTQQTLKTRCTMN